MIPTRGSFTVTRTRLVAVTLVGLFVILARLPGQVDAVLPGLPEGYQVLGSESLGAGVEHVHIRADEPAQDVHVARLSPGTTGRLQTVLAGNVLTGPGAGLETTSSMCARVSCVAAVNAEFADEGRHPVGGMVSGGELVTTPAIEHAYLRVPDGGGRPSMGLDFDWSAALTVVGRTAAAVAVNRPQSGDEPVLYTPRWGPSTGTDAGTTELVLALGAHGAGAAALPAGATALHVVSVRPDGNSPIGPGQLVLAGRDAAVAGLAQAADVDLRNPLEKLLNVPRPAVPATLVVGTGGARDTTGGSPLLLLGGQLAFPHQNDDSFTQDRHPRTMVGVTAGGDTLLVTIDGRQPGHSSGLTLVEAAELMGGLGAVDAVNLDGGGSTTFVTGGQVRNQPSDAAGERPVVSALVLVPGSQSRPLSVSGPAASQVSGPLPLDDPASRSPNLLGDLLPPVLKAIEPVTGPVVEALDPATAAPADDDVSRAVEDMLRAVQNGINARR